MIFRIKESFINPSFFNIDKTPALNNDENVRSEAAIMVTPEAYADDRLLLLLTSAYMLSPVP